ncbi:MAG: hypothetical protein JW782_03660 [Candidatus Saganbacteria bacterium]|nr:hypothetical protein [Candidatus Saganbacteria bacterium]
MTIDPVSGKSSSRTPGNRRFGSYFCRIDHKNRFSMPVAIRHNLPGTELVLVPSLNRFTNKKVLRVFSLTEWEKMIDNLRPEERDIYIAHSQLAELDKIGRLRIPNDVMQRLEFRPSSELAVIQDTNHIRVMPKSDFQSIPLPTL